MPGSFFSLDRFITGFSFATAQQFLYTYPMSIWTIISEFLKTTAADAFSSVVESLLTFFAGNEETRRQVAFSVAIIALSAKMAKADGIVTEAEVRAFHQVFSAPEEEMPNVLRLYNLAKQDVAGFDAYGAQVRALFPGDDPADNEVLSDVLDALFHIAKADGLVHENELLFLEELALVFGFQESTFACIKQRHLAPGDADPYRVLSADPAWPFDKLKAHYRKRVKETHPDRLIARGVPKEFIVISTERLAALNSAWETIEQMHNQTSSGTPALVG